jgi:hypothetical protein
MVSFNRLRVCRQDSMISAIAFSWSCGDSFWNWPPLTELIYDRPKRSSEMYGSWAVVPADVPDSDAQHPATNASAAFSSPYGRLGD